MDHPAAICRWVPAPRGPGRLAVTQCPSLWELETPEPHTDQVCQWAAGAGEWRVQHMTDRGSDPQTQQLWR